MLPLPLPPLILKMYIKTPITKQLSFLLFMWSNGPTIFKTKFKTPYNQMFITKKLSFCNYLMQFIFFSYNNIYGMNLYFKYLYYFMGVAHGDT